ncbi:MAG: DUF3422 domain-containing protein [Aquisalimonadaceae bacterium]
MNDALTTGRQPGARIAQHPDRHSVVAELHARPFESLAGPLRASHIAMQSADADSDRAHVARLCAACGQRQPAADATHHSVALGTFRLRWERHTEFSTYTFFVTGAPADAFAPFADPALLEVPEDWLGGLPGSLVAAVHLSLEPRDAPPRQGHELPELFGTENVAGSEAADGGAQVFTDFRLHEDGYGWLLVQDRGLPARRTGRLVQRLLEIETYRLMALLAFPLARHSHAEVTRLDTGLQRIIERITQTGSLESEQDLLDEISGLSAELERDTAKTSFRLSAARAYHALVNRRIESLREQRTLDLQTIGEFMERRFTPAMRTCESAMERQEALARRVSRAADLLRTRVDIALEGQNRDLLASMNRRTDLQLRLQQTVEGLSVVVLSYYGTGLLYYMLRGLHGAGLEFNVDLAMGLSVPAVVLTVWVGIRILRRRFVGGGE